MKFLVDAQLPPALARWLLDAGCEATVVRELGLRDADDEVIWRYAEQNDYVIITKDEDFVLRVHATVVGPSVLWLRVGNTSNARLRAWLIPQVPQLASLLEQGCRLIEVR